MPLDFQQNNEPIQSRKYPKLEMYLLQHPTEHSDSVTQLRHLIFLLVTTWLTGPETHCCAYMENAEPTSSGEDHSSNFEVSFPLTYIAFSPF